MSTAASLSRRGAPEAAAVATILVVTAAVEVEVDRATLLLDLIP
jgi:hypothetical protein